MKRQLVRIALAVAAAGSVGSVMAVEPIVQFNRGIGVDPVGGINGTTGLPNPNTVLGVAPGGRPWVIRKLVASFYADGTISARGWGLLFSGGDLIGTRGTISQVKATLFCSGVGYDSLPADLDTRGNFVIRGQMVSAPPNPCSSPVLLIRSLGGSWFAAGIVGSDDD
jgi:hypothetical protein